jgi:class 3 adenylate cyclase
VNRIARLLSAGHGGQILLSAVTYGLVRDNLSFLEPRAELRDLGEHRLKDLRYTERIYQLVVPDLPSEFPPIRTLDTRPY